MELPERVSKGDVNISEHGRPPLINPQPFVDCMCIKLARSTYLLGQEVANSVGENNGDALLLGEGPTVPRRLNPDNHVGHGEDAQEKHCQQESQVKVIGTGCTERIIKLLSCWP